MVCSAEWDRKLIADLDAQSASLRISHVVSMRGCSSANDARLVRNVTEMLLGANSLRFVNGEGAFVDYSPRNRLIRLRELTFF